MIGHDYLHVPLWEFVYAHAFLAVSMCAYVYAVYASVCRCSTSWVLYMSFVYQEFGPALECPIGQLCLFHPVSRIPHKKVTRLPILVNKEAS